MKRTKGILKKIFYPPMWVLCTVPWVSFTALILIFASGKTHNALAYVVYTLSAYSLAVLLAAVPGALQRVKEAIGRNQLARRIAALEMSVRYLNELSFRGLVSIYRGMIANFLYALFRLVAGVFHASVWFISMAVYYLVLGGMRAYLIACYRRRDEKGERKCYRRIACSLFLLNIPMGGMILLMIRTNSGYTHPGYIIYLSAAYTFYTMAASIHNIIKFRRLGSPILSAAKVLNFVAAMMSILGLQTSMISRFSTRDGAFCRQMNTITGICVYLMVILIAIYMLWHSAKYTKEAGDDE